MPLFDKRLRVFLLFRPQKAIFAKLGVAWNIASQVSDF
jgi:hypothetical protein